MALTELSAEEVALPRFDLGAERKGEVFDLTSHQRARQALTLALSLEAPGFNVFVVGADRSGRLTATVEFLEQQAADWREASDWVYLNNFKTPHRPKPYALPPGRGRELSETMEVLLRNLREAVGRAFSGQSYQKAVADLSQEAQAELDAAFAKLQAEAAEAGLTLQRTPEGFSVFAKDADGKPIPAQELTGEDKERADAFLATLNEQLGAIARRSASLQAEITSNITQMNRRVMDAATRELVAAVIRQFEGLPRIQQWLEAMQRDLVEHELLLRAATEGQPMAREALQRRYSVNLIVDRSEMGHPEVILEPDPTLDRLFGKLEYRQEQGSLTTDFTLIRGGALHRANGGVLVLRAEAVAREPGVWEYLKAALRDGEIRIHDRQQDRGGLPIAGAPRPKPIPLEVKVVLIGNLNWYYSFFAVDPDLQTHFKIKAEIDPEMDATGEDLALYAHLIQRTARQAIGLGCDDAAMTTLLGFCSRWAADRGKVSTRFELLADVLAEAGQDEIARGEADDGLIGSAAILKALIARQQRNARIEDRLQEQIHRETISIATRGEAVGQINGLTVMNLGDYAFGLPSRITARASMGRQGMVNIERDVELGGPIQQKGVMVLQGFINGHFSRRRPLSFDCSITFEQSYGGVEGDSASLAELIAVLADIAQVPIRQDIAVTGSVNQTGLVQAVGGVTHKVEGFFRTCRETGGLTGGQGVVLPASNAKHLALMPEVSEAVGKADFHIWTVERVEDAITLLTGLPAGERDEAGDYPEDSLYGRVARQLAAFDEGLAERRLASQT